MVFEVCNDLDEHVGYYRSVWKAQAALINLGNCAGVIHTYEDETNFPFGSCQDDEGEKTQ